ncbi:MAG: outer membrane beta-barrel protein [Saprospiraceae bacterium]|nr:outer membrane beta-barrel protein [Saprospiraceae bacterium]
MHAFARRVLFICCLISTTVLKGQIGIVAYTGLSLMYTPNPITNPENGFMSGYHFGIKALYGKKLFVEPGVSLHIMQQSAQKNLDPFNGNPSIYLLKIPLQMGYRLLETKDFGLRASAGGNLSFTTSVDENVINLNGGSVKDVQFGILLGGGLDFGVLSVDVVFEKGIIPFYALNDYKADFFFISVGFSL